jgi:hypothetical protein
MNNTTNNLTPNEILQKILHIPVNTHISRETLEEIQRIKAIHEHNEYLKQIARVSRWQKLNKERVVRNQYE